MQYTDKLMLTKYKGASVQMSAIARMAGVADHADFVALQRVVQDAMPDKSLYVPSTEVELLGDLTCSLCVGIWVQDDEVASQDTQATLENACPAGDAPRLIAYTIVRYDGNDPHNYAHYFELPAGEVPLWANYDSVVVHPDFRGNTLQQILLRLCIAWRRPDIIGFGCTVSPQNPHSLASVQAVGFAVHSRRVMYGKHDRFLLQMRLAPLAGKYRHFKGGEYRVLGLAQHSETLAPMVVYQALYGEAGLWVRPAHLWFEWVSRDAYEGTRFRYIAP